MEKIEKTLTLRQLQAIDDGIKVAEHEDANRAIPGASQGGRLAAIKGGTSYKFSRLKDALYTVVVGIKKEKQKFKEATATKRDEKNRVIEYDKAEYEQLEQEFLDSVRDDIKLPQFKLSELMAADGTTVIPMRLFNALFPLIEDDTVKVK